MSKTSAKVIPFNFKIPQVMTITAKDPSGQVELNIAGLWTRIDKDELKLPVQLPYDIDHEAGLKEIEAILKEITFVPAFNDSGYQESANLMNEALSDLKKHVVDIGRDVVTGIQIGKAELRVKVTESIR